MPLKVIPLAVTPRELPTLLWLKLAEAAAQVIPVGAGLSVQVAIVAEVVLL
jgi:hypothetical protein